MIFNPTSHVRHTCVADIQLWMPADYIVSKLPDIKAFGRACKYINDPSIMPDLNWRNSSAGSIETLDQNVDINVNITKHKYGL